MMTGRTLLLALMVASLSVNVSASLEGNNAWEQAAKESATANPDIWGKSNDLWKQSDQRMEQTKAMEKQKPAIQFGGDTSGVTYANGEHLTNEQLAQAAVKNGGSIDLNGSGIGTAAPEVKSPPVSTGSLKNSVKAKLLESDAEPEKQDITENAQGQLVSMKDLIDCGTVTNPNPSITIMFGDAPNSIGNLCATKCGVPASQIKSIKNTGNNTYSCKKLPPPSSDPSPLPGTSSSSFSGSSTSSSSTTSSSTSSKVSSSSQSTTPTHQPTLQPTHSSATRFAPSLVSQVIAVMVTMFAMVIVQ